MPQCVQNNKTYDVNNGIQNSVKPPTQRISIIFGYKTFCFNKIVYYV